jgi:hypothetical protein
MKKFVVYLTSYSGTLLPPKYIGSTSEKKILSGYFGSVKSKKWKDIFNSELTLNKHLFSIKILSYHETRDEALKEELRLQMLNDVVKSNEYFNESFARPNGFFGRSASGSNSPTYGIKPFERAVKKYGLQEAIKRRKLHYDKVSNKLKDRKQNSLLIEQRAKSNRGKKRTEEQIITLSNSHRLDIDKDILQDLFVNKGMTKSAIAKLFNCHRHTITNHLKYYGIKK